MEFNQRLDGLIKTLGHNKNSFSKKIGLENNVVIGRLVKEESRKPSFEILAKILRAFPDLNSRWLILGEGEMFLREQDDLPEFSDRLGRVMKYLLKSPLDMAGLTGMHVKEIGSILMQDSIISDKEIAKIARSISDSFPEINREWLEKNQTPMILSDTELVERHMEGRIPIMQHPEEGSLQKSSPQDFIAVKGFSDGFAIQMYGENMIPVISPSDMLICRAIPKNSILYGEIHLLLWKSKMRRVGYVKKGKETGTVELVSTNPDYESILLPVEDIDSSYLIEGVIKRFKL